MNKVQRIKQDDIINYHGNGIKIEAYESHKDDISIWNAQKIEMYSRIDLNINQLKELAEVLPQFIKTLEEK
jgi:hypothetical protein